MPVIKIKMPPLRTLFAKMYCCKCGERMHKEKQTGFIDGDPNSKWHRIGRRGFSNYNYIYGEGEEITYFYCCKKCGNYMSLKQQVEISKLQKKLGRNILAEEESKDIESDISLMF